MSKIPIRYSDQGSEHSKFSQKCWSLSLMSVLAVGRGFGQEGGLGLSFGGCAGA